MGEVWRAEDTKLGRDVALKLLPDLFAQDGERLARFEREARVLASLNHAHIAGIYGLHEAEGQRFLSMELVPGDDLSDLDWDGVAGEDGGKTYGDVFLQAEREFSAYNFEQAATEILFRHFEDAQSQCKHLLGLSPPLSLPAYDFCMKASHLFNLLDARGVISVTERQAYIGRVRELAKGCCEAWVASRPGAAARSAEGG